MQEPRISIATIVRYTGERSPDYGTDAYEGIIVAIDPHDPEPYTVVWNDGACTDIAEHLIEPRDPGGY